jgi:hypothetical protein
MFYDFVIVGGGVAGLYSAMRLEKMLKGKNIRILLLEKNGYLGGRTRMETFHSHKVVTGAGVGRFPKDRILQELVEASMGKKVQPVKTLVSYEFPQPVYTLTYVEALKQQKKWIHDHRSMQNFKDFFRTFYSAQDYERFCKSNGFTDFEKADIVDTLYDYGFEDNVPGNYIFPIDWNRLVRFMRKSLRHTTLHMNVHVTGYSKTEDGFLMMTTDQRKYKGRQIIVAGFVDWYPFPEVVDQIGFNSFLRMYSFSRDENDVLHQGGMTYYENKLQKSIYISPTLRTMSYSDNARAEAVMHTPLSALQQLAGYRFDDVVRYFWKHGTHYYKPLATRWKDRREFIRYAQHPEPGVFLVGECISTNQGWTEGALESVHAVEGFWKETR